MQILRSRYLHVNFKIRICENGYGVYMRTTCTVYRYAHLNALVRRRVVFFQAKSPNHLLDMHYTEILDASAFPSEPESPRQRFIYTEGKRRKRGFRRGESS